MGSFLIVVAPPAVQDGSRVQQGVEEGLVEQLVSEPPLKLSKKPFCIGLPGGM